MSSTKCLLGELGFQHESGLRSN